MPHWIWAAALMDSSHWTERTSYCARVYRWPYPPDRPDAAQIKRWVQPAGAL